MSAAEKKGRDDVTTVEDSPLRPEPTSDVRILTEHLNRDPRFNPPTPSIWKRLALLAFVAAIIWLAFNLRAQLVRPPKVVYANRYSKEYKYRPAASPIITERLKDGRTRVRGALPTVRA